MARFSRRRASATIVGSIVLALVGLPATALAIDATPPVAAAGQRGVEFWDYDRVTQLLDVRLTFVDPESGVSSVLISCDGGPEASYPYASQIHIPALDASAGGCAGYGRRVLQARAVNGDGAISFAYSTPVDIGASFVLEFPVAAETGKLFTVHVHYSAGFTPAPDTVCHWGARWGSVPSLRDNDFDETFGGMNFEGTAANGFCDTWTFTLPWVPEPRFEFNLSMLGANDIRTSEWPDRNLVTARVVGTDRRIRQSSLPIAQVLPSTYTPIVGQPVTYTRYLVGGATATAQDHPRWSASMGTGEDPVVWERWTTSSTFTITPPRTGSILVAWDRETPTDLLSAFYDPPVRYRDTSRPNTTAPVQRIGGALLGSAVPVTLTWGGTDRGWGISWYRLQQSVNGGAWTTIYLPTPKATSVIRMLTPGVSVRYRVRAVDKAGNVGDWDYGPTFRSGIASDGNPGIAYVGPWATVGDATAQGARLHESSTAGARATLRFTGRDVAWVAERGPGHGKAKVYIDGLLVTIVDLNAAAAAPRRVVYRGHWSTSGVHTIRIVVSGTGVVDIDAIAVLR